MNKRVTLSPLPWTPIPVLKADAPLCAVTPSKPRVAKAIKPTAKPCIPPDVYLNDSDRERCREISELPLKNGQKVIAEIHRIIGEVAEATGVPCQAIMGPGREKRVAQARQLAMYIARRHGFTYAAIGKACRRDHRDAMHNIRVEKERLGAR